MSYQSSPLVEAVIAFLLPYFLGEGTNIEEARTEIMDTLTSYGTRSRAEFLQAARIVALSMTTLDVLAEAKSADLSPSTRIRLRGSANGLNRSTVQTEKSLDQYQAREVPIPDEPMPAPVEDRPGEQAQGAIAHARAAIGTHPSGRPATASDPALNERDKRLYAGAMLDMLRKIGHPAQPIPAAPDYQNQTPPAAAIPPLSPSV